MSKLIGTVNGRVKSTAWLGTKVIEFDGTTRGLVRSAIMNGAKANQKILANFGGNLRSNAREMKIISAPHDDRAFGFWAV